MKQYLVLVLWMAFAATGFSEPMPVKISSFAKGELVCSTLQPGTTATVERAISPTGPWVRIWIGLADSNGVVKAAALVAPGTQAFYRVFGFGRDDSPSAPANGRTATGLDYAATNGAVAITGYSVGDAAVAIPSVINGLPVTSVGSRAFYGSGLTSVTIPDSVTSIGNEAFSNCANLTSVTIPDSVTSIGQHAFSDCSGLTSVTIPDSVTSLGQRAFYNCSGLTSVTIGNGVTSIGGAAFSSCASLTSITIPNGVTSLGSSAFSDCTGLTNATIGNGVVFIGDFVFLRCTGLTSVVIGNGVTGIAASAFAGCYNLAAAYFKGNAPRFDSARLFAENDYLIVYCLAGTTGWDQMFGGRLTTLWSP